VFYNTLLSYLQRGQQVVLWLGLILVVVGWFAGRNRTGAAARAAVAGGLETVGSALAGGPVGGAGRWVAANARWLRVVVGVLGVVVLLWGNDVSLSRLVWSVVLIAVLLAVIQVLIGAAGGPNRTGTAAASIGTQPASGPEPEPEPS
jgi:hypothetical protein